MNNNLTAGNPTFIALSEILRLSMNSKEKYYLLPDEDGATLIINNRKMDNKPDIRVLRKFDDMVCQEDERVLDTYLKVFLEEAKLKVRFPLRKLHSFIL